jgi:hypothetical protein
VTRATLALSAAGVIASLLLIAALLTGRWPALLVTAGVLLCLGFGLGNGSVLAVGVGHRRPRQSPGRRNRPGLS